MIFNSFIIIFCGIVVATDVNLLSNSSVSTLKSMKRSNITTTGLNGPNSSVRSQSSVFFSLFSANLPSNRQSDSKSFVRRRPLQNTSRELHKLLNAIDTRLRNGSLLLDSHAHVVVLQNNDTLNVTRTWSFQPRRSIRLNTSSIPRESAVTNRTNRLGGLRQHRRLSSHLSSGVHQKCERLTERQKYARLESVGGRNQLFMANSAYEAGRNFPRLLLSNFDDAPKVSQLMFSDATIDVNRVIDPSFCDEQCEEIRSKLEEVLLDSDASSAQKRSFPMFDGNEENEEPYEAVAQTDEYAESSKPTADRTQKSNGCQLGEIMNTQNYIEDVERFVPIGNCTLRGEEMWDDFEKLCSSCNGVYSLSENCFPRFVNSIICDQQDTSCIFDRYTGISQGKCKTRRLSFTVMQNRGTKMCEDWIFRFIEIPVGCECYLSKTSFLDSVPRLNN